MPSQPLIPFGRTEASPDNEELSLVRRIVAAYRLAVTTPLGSLDSFWLTSFSELKREIHHVLLADDQHEIQALLRHPSRSDLLYGFDNLAKSLLPAPTDPAGHANEIYSLLVELSEAVGGRAARCPEYPLKAPLPEIDALLAELDGVFGIPVDFPTPFAGEYGLNTSRGIISYRAVHAVYQAWRLSQLVDCLAEPRVLEIGGGLGRTAYYARQFGIRDYTLVDIPMTAVAQANFLGRVLGENNLQLYGEPEPGGVRILPPTMFLDQEDCYDIVLNVDSLTEMALETARAYCKAIDKRTGVFLSINHEEGRFKARDVFAGRRLYRAPYWLRRGYVEELSGRLPEPDRTDTVQRRPRTSLRSWLPRLPLARSFCWDAKRR
jgi:SAM-dependent methyltransferase